MRMRTLNALQAGNCLSRAIKKKSGSPGLRMSAEVSRITFLRARLQFCSTALFLDGPPKALEGYGLRWPRRVFSTFLNLHENYKLRKELLAFDCCRACCFAAFAGDRISDTGMSDAAVAWTLEIPSHCCVPVFDMLGRESPCHNSLLGAG